MSVTLLELGILTAACSPGARLLLRRDSRRIAPSLVAVLAALLAALAVLATSIALRAPELLHPVALVAAVLWAACLWRGRSAYGCSRRLPPGSLSFTRSVEAIVDRRFYQRQYERFGPIFKMAQFHRGVVCVVGIERGHRLLREHRDSLGPGTLPFAREISGGFLRYMEGETYERYGNLFRGALAGPVVRRAEAVTRRVIREELGRMAEDCSSSSEVSVPPGKHLERIVFASFARVLFDLTPGTADFRELETLYQDLRAQRLGRRLTARTKASLAKLRILVRRRAEQVREREPDAAGGSVLEALIRADPAMPDATCIGNLLFILKIASANVTSLLHWIVKLLGDHPEWLERMRAAPDDEDSSRRGPGLADRIVMETLRLEQSEYIYRTIRTAFRFEGFLFPRGWLLRICVKESHRDGAVFEDAERFDPDRFLARRFARAEYSPFGASQHACNGVDLTNLIARCVIEELARGFESRIVRDGPPERDFRHWDHWRPSSRLRLAISPRAAASPSLAGVELPLRAIQRR